jgi:hypothetical protein
VLFPARFWPGLADGSVTVAFRRWKRPSVRSGGTLQSPAGLLSIDEVSPITVEDITAADARSAGFGTPGEVIVDLQPDGQLYRIRFRRVGDDPRIALRQQADVDESTLATVQRLPWAGDVLRAIAAQPATVSTTLAAQLGMERQPFKQRVRRLKSLGLTESLEVGYRLSPRGEAVLARIGPA